jgi:hypothetical protein
MKMTCTWKMNPGAWYLQTNYWIRKSRLFINAPLVSLCTHMHVEKYTTSLFYLGHVRYYLRRQFLHLFSFPIFYKFLSQDQHRFHENIQSVCRRAEEKIVGIFISPKERKVTVM